MHATINRVSDLQVVDKAQYFPLYYYDEITETSGSLFDVIDDEDKYIRRDGISDWILKDNTSVNFYR